MANQNNPEKPSKLKLAFQWAGALSSTVCAEAPQTGFVQAGLAYDQAETWVRAKLAPKKPGPAGA